VTDTPRHPQTSNFQKRRAKLVPEEPVAGKKTESKKNKGDCGQGGIITQSFFSTTVLLESNWREPRGRWQEDNLVEKAKGAVDGGGRR